MNESMPMPSHVPNATPESEKVPTQSVERERTNQEKESVKSFETPPMTRAPSFAYKEAQPGTVGTEVEIGEPPDLGEKPAFIAEAEAAAPKFDQGKHAKGMGESGIRNIGDISGNENTRIVHTASSSPESLPDTQPYSDSPETKVVDVSPEWNGPKTEAESVDQGVVVSEEEETDPDTTEAKASTVRQTSMPADMEGPDSFDKDEAGAIRAEMESSLADPLATHKKEEEALRKGWKAKEPIEPAPTTLRSSDIPQPEADKNVIRGMGTIPVSREAKAASPAVLEKVEPSEHKSALRKFWDTVRGKKDDGKVA